MINKVTIVKLIDESYIKYSTCWDILCFIKNFNNAGNRDSLINGLNNFQYILAECLFKLENQYTVIAREKESMIKNKLRYNYRWFCTRLKNLSSYQKYIVTTINIGRTLGDAFAWFFYHKELIFLNEHLKHKEIDHLSTGVGSRSTSGTLAFADANANVSYAQTLGESQAALK
jgi:hypothetical protein